MRGASGRQTGRAAARLLALLALVGTGSAHAAGVDWGGLVITSVNNLVGQSGGAYVPCGLVMVAFAGLMCMLVSISNAGWSMIDSVDSFRVHFNFKELAVIAFKMWLLTQILNHWVVPIPGTSLSFHEIPMYISNNLVAVLAQGKLAEFNADVAVMVSKMAKPNPLLILDCIVYVGIMLNMAILALVTFILTAYGYVGEVIFVVVTPLFIWCALVPQCMSWLMNCIQQMLSFAMYRVMATIILYILSDLLVYFFINGLGGDYSIASWTANLPVVIMLTGMFVFSLFMIPLLCASIFNGAGAIGQAVILMAKGGF